jgi:hypothetical protein
VDGEGGKNQTNLQMRQRPTQTVHEIGHRLKSCRPKADGVNGEMQEKERAEDKSCDGEVLARAGTAAAPAVAHFSRHGKIHRQQITGRKVRVVPGVATAAALATIAQWKLFKLTHLFHGAAAKTLQRNGSPLSCNVDKQS